MAGAPHYAQWPSGRLAEEEGHPRVGQLGSYSGPQGAATPYGSQIFSQFGQAYGQQGGAVGSAGLSGGTSVNLSGIYGLDSKFPSSGYGVAGASTAAFTQKTDKSADFLIGQYLGADVHSDALKRYSESQLEQQSQAQLRQQQLLHSALRQGAAPSLLDGGVRSQSYLLSAGRNPSITSVGGGTYVGERELLGSTYGVTRSDAEAALLGTQAGLTARGGVGVLPFQSQAADSLASLAGGRGILGAMYPPGMGYSTLDLVSARSGISGMSDLAGIGSSRYDDRLDDRISLRYDYERRDDDRRERERSRERDRERERERSWEREREWEHERERQRERERARERERVLERERVRERERDMERELRRRGKTPPRTLLLPRRGEKVVKKASSPRASKFSSSIKPRKREYLCKVESFSLGEDEKDLLSLIRRYPRMYVAADFSKVVACWKERGLEIALNQPVSFEHDVVDVDEEDSAKAVSVNSAEEADNLKENMKWSVKVMLMSGATDDFMKDLSPDSTEEKPLHLHNFLKFVVLRKGRSALMGIGGAWDKTLDGGDPVADEQALIRTAIRCTKDITQLDLSGVASWKRFLEVHYDRVRDNNSTYKEITVFLIPDLSGCLPTVENWKHEWKQHREARLKREASQKQEKDGKPGASLKDKEEKKDEKDTKEEKKKTKKEEKTEKDMKKEDKKDKELQDEKKEAKKEDKKENDSKKEERKDKDVKQEDKKERDAKQDDKKEKDVKQDDKKGKDGKKTVKKDKDAKQEDKKEKEGKKEDKNTKRDKKAKVEEKDGEKEKVDDKKKEEKKEDKDAKATKGKGPDKKSKGLADEKAPELPGLFVTLKRNKSDKDRAMTISLDGLLDYDERDKEESTFEVSLFAEIFQEMLQYKFGLRLLEAFESIDRDVQARKKEEKKRPRQEDPKGAKKKSKFSDKGTSDTSIDTVSEKVEKDNGSKKDASDRDIMEADVKEKKDESKPVKDIDAAMQEASMINFDELEEELQEATQVKDADSDDDDTLKQETNETKKSVVVDEELLKAFRYFDKNGLGFLKAEDARRLIHILGKFLSRRLVKDLTSSALTESKSKDECIYYQKLVAKELE